MAHYALVESAERVGIDPAKYLRAAAEAAIRDGAGATFAGTQRV